MQFNPKKRHTKEEWYEYWQTVKHLDPQRTEALEQLPRIGATLEISADELRDQLDLKLFDVFLRRKLTKKLVIPKSPGKGFGKPR